MQCRVGRGEPTWVRAGDWRLYARLDGASDGADADEVIASFVAEGGRAARGYRAPDGRVVVPFGFAEAYAGYAAELWADGRGAVRPLPAAAQCLLSIEARDPSPRPARGAEGLDPRPGRARLSPLAVRRQRRRPAPVLRALRPGRRAEAGAALPLVLAARRPRGRDPDPRRRVGRRDSATPFGSPIWSRRGACARRSTSSPPNIRSTGGSSRSCGERGFELGVHGVFHDRSHVLVAGRSSTASSPALRDMAERLGADGFRSPATHRVNPWLAELPGGLRLHGADVRSVRAAAGRLLLAVAVLHRARWSSSRTRSRRTTPPSRCCASRTIDLWLRQLDRIEDGAGTRPVRLPSRPGLPRGLATRRRYTSEFLDAVAERDGVWRALPREVAAWWRERDRDRGEPALGEAGIATLDEAGSVVLQPAADPPSPDSAPCKGCALPRR